MVISGSSAAAVGRGGYKGAARGGGGVIGTSVGMDELRTCPSSIHILQQPLFDMLRTIFSRGDQFASQKPDMFALAVECWLLWLQPWKARALYQFNYSLQRVDKAGPPDFTYEEAKWYAYISANLHFYTTLLVCFLNAMSRMDLSVSNSDVAGQTHLFLLERVLLAFEPLKNTITKLDTSFRAWYPEKRARNINR